MALNGHFALKSVLGSASNGLTCSSFLLFTDVQKISNMLEVGKR